MSDNNETNGGFGNLGRQADAPAPEQAPEPGAKKKGKSEDAAEDVS